MTRINLADLARPGLSVSQKWLMLLRHFLASPYGQRAVGEDVLKAMYAEYKTAQRQEGELYRLSQITAEVQATGPAAPDQLAVDYAAILPHLSDIIQDGQFAYGHQSKLARLLGGQNAGAFRENRLLPLLDRLEREHLHNRKEQAA